MGFILWRPLYYASIALFIISIVLFPFSRTWSVLTALFLVSLWSSVPGLATGFLASLHMHDVFSFIIASTLGVKAGLFFGFVARLTPRLFTHKEDLPYTIAGVTCTLAAVLCVPIISFFAGKGTLTAFLWYEGIVYVVYYIIVILFFKETIGEELMHFPVVVLIDFVGNAFLIKLFGGTLSGMIANGPASGWPFIVFSGIILSFFVLAKNGTKAKSYLERKLSPFKRKTPEGNKRETYDGPVPHFGGEKP